MPSKERTPYERETLVFDTPEAAQQFSERVSERLQQTRSSKVKRDREVVGQELAKEFEKEGTAVSIIKQPWEHTQAEHEEVQRLVNTAFAKDLPAALRQARAGGHFPRNLDLLHDVLTGEMYDLMRSNAMNKQPQALYWISIGSLTVVVLLIAVLLFLVP